MNNFDYSRIQNILNRLLVGDLSIITDENTQFINQQAINIYQTEQNKLYPSDIDGLKNILRICNILYNRTELRVLVIEDGFYE